MPIQLAKDLKCEIKLWVVSDKPLEEEAEEGTEGEEGAEGAEATEAAEAAAE